MIIKAIGILIVVLIAWATPQPNWAMPITDWLAPKLQTLWANIKGLFSKE